MKRNDLIILCGVFIAVVAIICVALIVGNPQVETNLVTTIGNVNQGEDFVITLMDKEGTKLVNQTIIVTLSNGVQSKDYNFTTDENGTVKIPVNLPAGNYTINGSFQGNGNYTNSSFLQQLNVIGNNILSSTFSDSGSSSSGSNSLDSNGLTTSGGYDSSGEFVIDEPYEEAESRMEGGYVYDHYPDADTSGDGYISSGEYDEYFY